MKYPLPLLLTVVLAAGALPGCVTTPDCAQLMRDAQANAQHDRELGEQAADSVMVSPDAGRTIRDTAYRGSSLPDSCPQTGQ